MKKLVLFMSWIILALSGCSDESVIEPDSTSLPQSVNTRTAGDGIYDVLGYGYDITEEYMGENSTKLRIIDVDAFVKDHKDRFDNPFIGIIGQRVFAGEDAYSFLHQVITDTNFEGSVGKIGIKDDAEGFFSGTIKTGFKSNTMSSYSTKYSFARAEVLKKQRRYLLNTDISTLSQYLSATFIEDLNKYSAAKIVEMYGTHVLTQIIVGGKYVADYKSAITEETNRTEKTKTVSAGAKFNLSSIGLNANGAWNKTEITETNKKNTNWECHIKSIGGSTSGTSITVTPDQSTSYTINLGAWSESVDDKHSKLIDADWNATYPIYDLISDPIKKQKVKEAVLAYIDSKKIVVKEVNPFYRVYKGKDRNTFYSSSYEEIIDKMNIGYLPDPILTNYVQGYVFKNADPGTVPIYRLYKSSTKNSYYTTSWDEVQDMQKKGYNYDNFKTSYIQGYIYKNEMPGTVPLYRLYKGSVRNTFYTTSSAEVKYMQNMGYALDPEKIGYIIGYMLPYKD